MVLCALWWQGDEAFPAGPSVRQSVIFLLKPYRFGKIENGRKWLYQLLPIKYELKLPSKAIQNPIQAV